MTDAPQESAKRKREIARLEKRIEALEKDRNQFTLSIIEQAVESERRNYAITRHAIVRRSLERVLQTVRRKLEGGEG